MRQIILFGFTAIALTAQSAPLDEQEQAYLSGKGEIVFVVQPDHAPFEFVHKKHVTGINVELAQWMAADMGFKIRLVTAPLDEALDMLRNGEADVVTSLFRTPEREVEFDFTQTLKMNPVVLYVRNDREDIQDLYSLNNCKIAIVGSEHALEILQQHRVNCEVRFVSSVAEGIELVTGGKIDALIANELITEHYMYATDQSTLKMVGAPLYTARLCMAVNPGDKELRNLLNKGISHAQKTGTLKKIQAKWLGSEYARRILPMKSILIIASSASWLVALLIALILLWNRKLKRKVDERTRQYAESEDRLRQIFENSPDAVFVLDQKGHILSGNERACKLTGMNKLTLLAKRIHDLAPEEFWGEVDENMHKWFTGELKQCEGVSQSTNGKMTPIEMTGSLQQMDGREVLQLHARDITMRKEADEKMQAAREMAEKAKLMAEKSREIAEHANRAKSEFLANMSHEIRTPLNGIVGMAQLISDTPLNSEQQNCLETILQSTGGLLSIINHVLDISKIEAGQMDVRVSAFDPREMCAALHTMLHPQADAAGIQLKCECQDNVPLYVSGDEGLIEQILINLLGNALKFTHNGSITLNIECHKKTADGAELYFQVIDTGIGIGQDKQMAVFDKFTQADGTAKRLYGGTGLGLAICKQLVELMGGSIGLISSTGQGSTFFFNLTLPIATQPDITNDSDQVSIKTVSKPDLKVLLVEDNLVNQKVATAILQRAGCIVETADNGQDAIQRVQTVVYDVVLMDCQMPVMDGFEATARIRAMNKPLCDIPIIAITAHAMKDDKQKCLDGGMNDYISKPVSRQELIDLINKYIS